MKKHPLFILGSQRSGTTFLAHLMSATDYGRPFETHFITKYYDRLGNYGDLSDKKNFTTLLGHILKERPVMQWKLEIDFDKFFDELDNVDYSSIINKLCMLAAEKKGYAGWGDKTPHYVGRIDIIHKLFPEAKYIYIVRDGRDVALSVLRVPWAPYNILKCAEQWMELNAESPIIEKLKTNGNLMQIKYEDLISDTDRIIRELYSFLNQKYDQKDLTNLASLSKKGNFKKWKVQMKKKDVEVFERIAANTLKRFGYETSHEETGVYFLKRLGYELHERILLSKHLFKLNIIDMIKIKYFGKEPFAE